MGVEPSADERQAQYLRHVRKRVRRSSIAVESRLIGLQTAWAVSLLAGGAVSLAQAFASGDNWLGDNAQWITAFLGFVVVVAQGADRLLGRTAAGAEADDILRRSIGREQRMFEAREGDYRDHADAFGLYVDRVEEIISEHDDKAVAFARRLLSNDQ